MLETARRGGELTRKLLAFSRKQILQPQPVELGETVTSFARVMQRLLGEDVRVLVEPPEEPLVVHVDPV